MDTDYKIYRPDPSKQIPIDSEIVPDSMDQEQPDLDEDKCLLKFKI
jgi:hypothetical protein